ncbi:hypothetical protein PS2_008131 [Malus domestica]
MGSPISKSRKATELHIEPQQWRLQIWKTVGGGTAKQAAQTDKRQINHPRQCNSNEHDRRWRNRQNMRPRHRRKRRINK